MGIGIVNITRGASAPKMTRGDVQPGQVFAIRDRRTGKLGTNYASIGSNGRAYSVNLKTGEVASADNMDKPVEITGKWEFHINDKPTPSVARECRRSEVKQGEVFHVNGKKELYAHFGSITRALNGFLSVPLSRTENHAVTRNGNSRVKVVASYKMQVELAE